MLPRDTTRDAHEAQMRWLRRLAPADRVELAFQLSEDMRELARAGIATRHPEYSAAEVTFALRRLVLGDALFRSAWPRAPLLAP